MATLLKPDNPELCASLNRLYRQFFDRAERNRRWSLREDIPWEQVSPDLDPALVEALESLYIIELYLPDYLAKGIAQVRKNKGWAWFQANWAYEESKHSLGLGDWFLRSGLRSKKELADLEEEVYAHEYHLPYGTAAEMAIYGMVQELATWVQYRQLRQRVAEHGDAALVQLLNLIAIDERCHYAFYRALVQQFLRLDRHQTLEYLRRVLLTFSLPALGLLDQGQERLAGLEKLGLFNEDIYLRAVYQPILTTLNLTASELEHPSPLSLPDQG